MVYAYTVCLQVKLCDPHLSALEMRFSRRGAIQIYFYLYLYTVYLEMASATIWFRARVDFNTVGAWTTISLATATK